MKSWWAILLPLALGLIGLGEFLPRLRSGSYGLPQILGLMIVGVCFGVAWGGLQARRKSKSPGAE
ncbi:MAG: hypothetical protein ACRD1Y_01290 [Terriglobales bacterium]